MCDIDAWDDNYLFASSFAAKHGHLAVFRLLVSKGADPSLESREGAALKIAAKKNHEALCCYLLEESIGFNKEHPCFEYVLESAAQNGMERACSILLNNFDFQQREVAIWWASVKGHINICKLLVEHGADVNPAHFPNPLKPAAQHRHEDLVEYFLNLPNTAFKTIIESYQEVKRYHFNTNEVQQRIILKLQDALKKKGLERRDSTFKSY